MKNINHGDFLKEARSIHGDIYSYPDLKKYFHNLEPINIQCEDHGVFTILAQSHLNGSGCRQCVPLEIFEPTPLSLKRIKRAIEKHGNKYDYSFVANLDRREKEIFICPDHGEFHQTFQNHIQGNGCPSCSKIAGDNKKRSSPDQFFAKALERRGTFFDLSETVFEKRTSPIKVRCPEHGYFEILAIDFLYNKTCPDCDQIEFEKQKAIRLLAGSKGEVFISYILTENNIPFEFQKTFEDCRNPKTGWKFYFDFYLPDINTIIEYDGAQHFIPVEIWGGEDGLIEQQARDKFKNQYCQNKGINIIRIRYDESIPIELSKAGLISL